MTPVQLVVVLRRGPAGSRCSTIVYLWHHGNCSRNTLVELSQDEKQFLLTLARRTVEARVAGLPVPEFANPSPVLNTNCGAFVTLHKHGDLRGCIGYIEAYKSLQKTIAEMAESAALRDPRFHPVSSKELKDLHFEISVLSPLRTIDDPKEIEVGKHGIVIERGRNRGLLLPQVATEQGWDRETFLDNSCMKAGLEPGAWKSKATTIRIFTATVFGEKEAGH